MIFAITFLVVFLALTVLLLGLSTFLQGYLYQDPAERLALRALVAGLGVSLFLGGWTFINTRASSENKYGTFFEFNPTSSLELTEFDAIRLYPRNPEGAREKAVPHKKIVGATAAAEFVDAEELKPFRLNDSNYLTIAIAIAEPGKDKKARFDAELKDGKYYATSSKVFREVGSSRYLEGESPGTVYVPSTLAVIVAMLVNLGLFLVLGISFWLVLRFDFGHAIGLSVVFGLLFMLVLMPLLFRLNKPKPVLPANPTPAVIEQPLEPMN